MILTPAQNLIAGDTHLFRVLNCGRRFGKTTLALEEMLGVALGGNEPAHVYYAPRDEPEDEGEDALDALRYPIMMMQASPKIIEPEFVEPEPVYPDIGL